jgi:bile acid:Na+ symporter, BASS family
MESSLLTNVLLPVALGVIMLGLGLSLTIEDFTRVVRYPKAVVVGLFVQMVLLTAICFGITVLFKLPPELAVGMMLLAASPGGATANIYSHLAHGDVALNITLTAIKKVIEVAVIILAPVAIGMFLRSKFSAFAAKMEKPIRIFSVILLAGLVVAAVIQEWGVLVKYFAIVGLACLTFNVASMAIGYGVPLAVKLPDKQAIAIAMEIGIHNGTLAIFIALNVLNNGTMSVPAAIYSLFMFVTAGIFAWWLNKRHGA